MKTRATISGSYLIIEGAVVLGCDGKEQIIRFGRMSIRLTDIPKVGVKA